MPAGGQLRRYKVPPKLPNLPAVALDTLCTSRAFKKETVIIIMIGNLKAQPVLRIQKSSDLRR